MRRPDVWRVAPSKISRAGNSVFFADNNERIYRKGKRCLVFHISRVVVSGSELRGLRERLNADISGENVRMS